MTFCEGFKVTDAKALESAELDRDSIMRTVTESFAYQVKRGSALLLSTRMLCVYLVGFFFVVTFSRLGVIPVWLPNLLVVS